MSVKYTQAIKQALNDFSRQGVYQGRPIGGDARIARVQVVDHNCFNVYIDTGLGANRCFEISIKERF
jgi:hypothetical protein